MFNFPKVFDNTMLSLAKTCEVKAYWRIERNLTLPQETSIDLVAGGAFADGLAEARKSFWVGKESREKALARGLAALETAYGKPTLPRYTLKTLDRMLGALAGYLEKWQLGNDGLTPMELNSQLMVEQTLSSELPFSWYRYGGKLDMLACDEDGVVWVVDEKTTGKEFDEKWLGQWDLDSQMTGYIWLAQQIYTGREVGGAKIRGVRIGRDGPVYQEVEVRRRDWEIERWINNTAATLQNWEAGRSGGWARMALDWQCGRCEYHKLCKAREPELLVSGYVENKWNPFGESNDV